MKKIVSFGGGTNSAAMLINMVYLNIIPEAILFSDTGGEHPYTYEFINTFDSWLKQKNFPSITVLKYSNKDGQILTLEQDCLNNNTIPPIAFGWKTCSQKFKILPQEKYIKNKYQNEIIELFIGFDCDEQRRMRENPNKNFINKYPLIEWNWNRQKCIEVIQAEGLSKAGKSSCFFCPNMKRNEILSLPKDLQDRCIAMEKNATKLAELKGLGRNKSWTEIIEADRNQLKIEWQEEDWHEISCECIE
jgi:hypothetical protein